MTGQISLEGMEEEVRTVIERHGPGLYPEAFEWMKKAAKEPDKAGIDLISRIATVLTRHLSDGLLQITVEELAREKECTDAIREKKKYCLVVNAEKTLDPLFPYIEFVARCGAIEMGTARYDFRVDPKVRVKDAKITILQDRIERVSFGSFIVSLTLSILKGENKPIKLGEIEKEFKPDWVITVRSGLS